VTEAEDRRCSLTVTWMIPPPVAAYGSGLFSIPVQGRPQNVPDRPYALFPLAIDLVHQAQERLHRLGVAQDVAVDHPPDEGLAFKASRLVI
jgi:hypothetical protein